MATSPERERKSDDHHAITNEGGREKGSKEVQGDQGKR